MKDLARVLTRAPIPLIDIGEARAEYATFRGEHGAKAVDADLFTKPEENVKFDKTQAPTYGLAFAQAGTSLVYNTCRYSTGGCRLGCVADAGKGGLDSVKSGRVRKTIFAAEHTSAFMTKVVHELGRIERKWGTKARVRLNTFSDIPWEDVYIAPGPLGVPFTLFELFPNLSFYDYTKWPDRVTPANYRLVRSASEKTTRAQVQALASEGATVAVVLGVKRGHLLPRKVYGIPVIDGDATDDRTLDPKGVIIGLRAKGAMRSGSPMVVSDFT